MRAALLAALASSSEVVTGPINGPTISAALTSASIGGSTNSTLAAGRINVGASSAAFTARIRGTGATMPALSGPWDPVNSFMVSVDGAAFAPASVVSGQLTLFAGLTDDWHKVDVRPGAAYAGVCTFPTAGNGLTITGATPQAELVNAWTNPGDAKCNSGAVRIANPLGGVWAPSSIVSDRNGTVGSNTGTITLRGTGQWLVVLSTSRAVDVAINGDLSTVYYSGTQSDGLRSHWIPITGDATYRVTPNGGGAVHIGVAGSILAKPSFAGLMEQWGDSITESNAEYPDTVRAWAGVETFRAAQIMGRIGVTYGVSGHTTAQCKTRMQAILTAGSRNAADVCIIAIGVNDGSFTAGEIADYQLCIDTALAAGYGKVLCRQATMAGYASMNSAISAIVSGRADSRVKLIQTGAGSGWYLSSALHPTLAEYALMAAPAAAAYSAAIA